MTPPETEFDPERVVIRDKRRLDPDSGEVRAEAGAPAPDQDRTPALDGDTPSETSAPSREEELLADLQRVTAEYANYRKRVDRDRVTVLEIATARLLDSLLPLLDSIELARQHGDLEGAFKGVGEGLEQVAERHGLERLGVVGDPFDPALHHALMPATEDPLASVATVAEVLQPGWRLKGGRVLRPAGVSVAEPGASPEAIEAGIEAGIDAASE